MAVARKIAYNVVLNSFLKVFSTVVLSLFSIRLITGYLGPDGFGDYSTILAFFAFFSALADLGISAITAREISREGADEKKILSSVFSLRLAASFFVVCLSPALIFFFQYPDDVKIGISFAALAILFSTTSLFLNGIFQKRLAMDKVALVEFFGKLLQVGLVLIIVKADLGFLPIAATLVAALSFNAVFIFFLSRRFIRFAPHFDKEYWRHFLGLSWPIGVTAIISFAYFKMDTILLSLLRSSAEVGIYNVAYKIMENLIFFPAMLAGLILPLLSKYIFTQKERFRDIANTTFRVFFIIVTPLVVGTVFLAKDIVSIVGGGGFEASAPVLQVLVFSLACIFFGHFFTMILVAGNAQKKLMQTLFLAATVNIILNSVFIREFSYMGAATVSVITEAFVVFLTWWLAKKYVEYTPSWHHISRVIFSGCAMAGVLFLVKAVPFFFAGFVGVFSYLFFLWLTKAVTIHEVRSLFSRREKMVVGVETPIS
ncbi:MAG: flippase [Candidatus Moranbacteria bacterium]|nr:flippase [Candidatus Moranbacteria bacterium]